MKPFITIFSIAIFSSQISLAQKKDDAKWYTAHFDEPSRIKNYTLIDSITKTKFILDTARIIISAIDSSGKKIWETDAWKDNHLEIYRFDRPRIVRFFFPDDNNWAQAKNAIWICYNNTQTGVLDKSTGKFSFLGQD